MPSSPAAERGTVTAELAAALPAVLLLLLACVGALSALTERALLFDGAAEAARATARGDPPALGALRGAVGEIRVGRSDRDGLVCVTLTSPADRLPGVMLTGESCAAPSW
ncbi:MAG: hypothetical protein JWP66_303 [Naasia sp.]|nr:hypothetical protein [Naasia sp.]